MAEACPDCGRTLQSSRAIDDWERFDAVDCSREYVPVHDQARQCYELTITKLRARLAELESQLSMMRAAFRPQNIANPREARQHIENLRVDGKDEAIMSLARELHDANARISELEQQQADVSRAVARSLASYDDKTKRSLSRCELSLNTLVEDILLAEARARKATSGGG